MFVRLKIAYDPVCGRKVKFKKAAGSRQYRAEIFYFCSEKCIAEFDKELENVIKQNNQEVLKCQ